MNSSKFNPIQSFDPGYIGIPCNEASSLVKFGGRAWRAVGENPLLGDPTLLATIDLSSPLLSEVVPALPQIEIPLFSYINLNGMVDVQDYTLDVDNKIARFFHIENDVGLLSPEDRIVTPLPESPLTLRRMIEQEIPLNEKSYWESVETFLGGAGFLRVLGKPVFVDNYIEVDDYLYFASIGYESFDQCSGLIGGEAFFVGEIAHYFFVSEDWKRVKVVSQAS